MKVKVKLRVKSAYTDATLTNCEANRLVAYYKTNRGFFYKHVDIIRIDHSSIIAQVPFVKQLEKLLSGGNMFKTVKNTVIEDILTKRSCRQKEKLLKDKENKLISVVDGLRFGFEFDDDKLNN